MLFSEKYRYVFLANPKTGTVATQNTIKKMDPSVMVNRISFNSSAIKFPGHGNALLLKEKMQGSLDGLRVFAFVRNPLDKIVSSYYFYRNGNPLTHGSVFNYSGLNFIKALWTYFQIILSRFIPFSLWSIIRMVKSNEKFLVDENGVFIVNYIGDTKNLQVDLEIILSVLGMENKDYNVRKENISRHKNSISYFEKEWHRAIIHRRYARELKLYYAIANSPVDFDYRGKRIDEFIKMYG